MKSYRTDKLCHGPVLGYIPFVPLAGKAQLEFCERFIIDGLRVQGMRQIRQLQAA
jgi:hypothetical protein